MTTTSLSKISVPVLRRTLVAAAIATASASGWAVQVFTISPATAGLSGTPAVADKFILSDYSTVRLSGNTFTESGFLPVVALQLAGSNVPPLLSGGLNSTYGLYYAFTANGTLSGLTGTVTANYQLYGYNGPPATFGFDGNNDPTISGNATLPGATLLATGTSISPGTVFSFMGGNFADLNVSVIRTAAGQAFFPAPVPFYTAGEASFSNAAGDSIAFAGGFKINGGSGTFVFAPVPEPETYALMLAGLVAVGYVAKRRKS